MDLVPLVSNADNKIILLVSNVNNNRKRPVGNLLPEMDECLAFRIGRKSFGAFR